MDKAERGVSLLLGKTPPSGVQELLERIFWKNPGLAGPALDFLDHIRDWSRSGSPYCVKEWEGYCIRKGITQSSYHNMLRRLRKAGMVEKRYNPRSKEHELHLTEAFSENLFSMSKTWEQYLRS